uniref:Uncharacterized protein n=1 Tax=Heterorhabditis bacteriophora TaxID=37862 RepID=A0A1I7X4H2_HETBA
MCSLGEQEVGISTQVRTRLVIVDKMLKPIPNATKKILFEMMFDVHLTSIINAEPLR